MIWQDSSHKLIYQGSHLMTELTPLERALLTTFLMYPKQPLTKTKLIEESWPEDVARAGVSDNSLFQLIRSLRRKLQANSYSKYDYIENWRAYPEGGYIFYPNGKQPSDVNVETAPLHELLGQVPILNEIIKKQQQTLTLLYEIIGEVHSE